MTLDAGIDTGRIDAHRLAAAARSILSCPAEVQLVVDGIDDLAASAGGDPLEMRNHGGRPVFVCPVGSVLARAAAEGRGALLTLDSGLGRPDSIDRDATLTLSGRLEMLGSEECPCCDELRVQVAIALDFAVLTRASAPLAAPDETRVRVPLTAFTSPQHDLNRGLLQRSVEHANDCHQDELRRAVATRTDTRLREIVGVQLADLTPDHVVLEWVDVTGAHQATLPFSRTATTTHELGDLLRSELHAGLC